MDRSIVFISSTFADLSNTRSQVAGQITQAGHFPILAENGELTYDSEQSLDESCYGKVRKSHVFVLIIGRRYGSPATASTPNGKKKLYKSVTLKEYETARDHGLPILAFVLRDIKAD